VFQNFPPYYSVEGSEQKKAAVVAQTELQDLLQDLLDAVATGFPADDLNLKWADDGESFPCLFVVGGPCQTPYSVSPFGFMLLEEIEGAAGSTEQRVEKFMNLHLEGPLMSALTNRLGRQQGLVVGTTTIRVLMCTASLGDLSTLIMNCQRVKISGCLTIVGEARAEGWAALGKALSRQNLQVANVTSSKSQMAFAREEDLRALWDTLSVSWNLKSGERAMAQFHKRDGEEAWEAMKHCLRMADGDLVAEQDAERREEEEEENEDTEGGE